VTRGFLLGKFMPPDAGHIALWDAALRLVDELTILVCSLPNDPIPGPMRLSWVRQLAPTARVIGHDKTVPQAPEESPDFWPIWQRIVRTAHPEPLEFLFAGETYGEELARRIGARFVGLGGRIVAADRLGVGGVSATGIRRDPWAHWRWLPSPVRAFYSQTFCLHGVESTGKSVLAERLAEHFDTIAVAEYGRIHCDIHGTDCTRDDLLLIGRSQHAMIEAAKPWCNRRLITDTDALMTAAWCQMMIGDQPDELLRFPKADLYLLLEPDVPWSNDGTRLYGGAERARFHEIAATVLQAARVQVECVHGDWDQRFERAVELIESIAPPTI
jgi:HTH-type transcriptional repressor of NAD biosynthesis genes